MVYSHRCTCSCTARGDCAKYQLRASLQDGSVRKGEWKRRSLLLKLFGTVASSLTGKITGNIRGYLCLLCKVLLFFFTRLQFAMKTISSHALTMSSTPFTLVGCMILILWAFFEETQCSSPSSSNNWICPVSENFTVAPIGTSNSPPVVWSSQTWSPYSGNRHADS